MSFVHRGIAAALGLLIVAGFAPAVSHAEAVPQIMLIGDSITAGYSGDWTWRYRLSKQLSSKGVAADLVGPHRGVAAYHGRADEYGDPDFDQDHAAVQGRRWAGLASSEDAGPAVVAQYDPDVVVIMLGVNDLVFGQLSPPEVRDLAVDYIHSLQSGNPEIDIVLGELTPIAWADVAPTNALMAGLPALLSTSESRVVLARTSEDYHVEDDTFDYVHPAASGEVKIAAAMADALAVLGIGETSVRPLPVVPQGPRIAPDLSAWWGEDSTTNLVAAHLSWVPHGADGEYVWVRSGTATGWRRMSTQYPDREATVSLDPAQSHELMLQPVKGRFAAADDVRSNVITLPALDPALPTPSPQAPVQPLPESGSEAPVVAPSPSTAPTPTSAPLPVPTVSKPGRVRHVKTRVTASGGVVLTWKQVRGATTYRVLARRAGTKYWLRFPTTVERRRVIGPLMAGDYLVRVMAINSAGATRGRVQRFQVR